MEKLYRIIDANVNRISEGLRVLEDLARFYYDDKISCENLKKLRHNVRKGIMDFLPRCIEERDSIGDVGLDVSKKLGIDGKASMDELVTANFKRVQEGLRACEETLKLLGYYELSKSFEEYRYTSYTLEKECFRIASLKAVKAAKLKSDLYCLTAEEYSKGRDNISVVRDMIDAGIKIIQYREKDKKALQKYNECLKIREMTSRADVTLIINDDIDIALSVGADGIHIGQDDLPIEKARQIVGDKMIIGLSTHSPEQAEDAVKRGADYIGVGPIFRTFTKKDVCEPVGLEYLEYAVKNVKIPFVAIGGIKEDNVLEVSKRGAKCIAMVTEIVGADDIKAKIESIRQRIERSK